MFEAEHVISGRAVALKLPRGRWRGNAEVSERLLREARALELVKHDNVVAALDAGTTEDGTPYLALELLAGRPLQGLLAARQRLSIDDTVAIGCQLCAALQLAHDRGVVHRDVKPGNLFVAADEHGRECLKLLDFGVASFLGAAQLEVDRKLTLEGSLLGTAEYMAPEQLLTDPDVDHLCDIYAIGVTLYECLTGTVPFEGTYGQVLLQATREPLPRLQSGRPDAPPELALAIETALQRSRKDRFPSATHLRDALLSAVGAAEPTRTRLCIGQLPPVAVRADAATSPATRVCEPPAAPRGELGDGSAVVQRRRFLRAPYVTPVTIRRADGSTLFGRSEDISEGGLLVMTGKLCQQGERVHVRFVLPGTGQFVEAAADTRWVRSGRGLGVAGLELVGLDVTSRDIIRDHVARADRG